MRTPPGGAPPAARLDLHACLRLNDCLTQRPNCFRKAEVGKRVWEKSLGNGWEEIRVESSPLGWHSGTSLPGWLSERSDQGDEPL